MLEKACGSDIEATIGLATSSVLYSIKMHPLSENYIYERFCLKDFEKINFFEMYLLIEHH